MAAAAVGVWCGDDAVASPGGTSHTGGAHTASVQPEPRPPPPPRFSLMVQSVRGPGMFLTLGVENQGTRGGSARFSRNEPGS